MPSIRSELGAGNRGGRRLAAALADERIVGAVDHDRRDVELAQRRGPITRGDDRDELAQRSLGVDAAVERARRPPRGIHASSRSSPREPITARAAAELSTNAARSSSGGRVIRTSRASAVASPTERSPVVDMIEQSERTRSGRSIAIVWAIIPPIDAPTTWAAPMSSWSSRPTASAAMSRERVRGTVAGRGERGQQRGRADPVEHRSSARSRGCRSGRRRTRARRAASQKPSGQTTICAPSPMTRSSGAPDSVADRPGRRARRRRR